ncbi:MAG TPA: tetratricopeptide repeat protein [Polyangia bacterium]|nr:tetratricopeptide repeat protein [Polyangia bacterium]
MPKNKLSRKQLRQPDEFVGFWTRTGEAVSKFASSHTRALVVSATALVTVVAGSVVIAQLSQRRAIAASEALDRVEQIETADLIVAGATPKDDGLPHFATEKERLEAALKELDAAFGSGHGPLIPEALLARGSILLDLDRADEAIAVYEKLLADHLDSRLRFLAREGLGYGYERKGRLDDALRVLSKLGDDAQGMGDFYQDRALYHQARLAELRGNPANASKLYKEVLEKSPTTSLREEITNRLASLELK